MTHEEVEPSGLYYDSLIEDSDRPPSVIFYTYNKK
jgi:hypothetical protein